MASSDSVKRSDDLISNMPELVIYKILKRLPLPVAAKMSILSKKWRRTWLSCQYLKFGHKFWKKFSKSDGVYDWPEGMSIINNILVHHNGSIHSLHLNLLPCELLDDKNASLCQWLSLLSGHCPKKFTLNNWVKEWSEFVSMPSHIFNFTELRKLELCCVVLDASPSDFKVFPHLKTLELSYVRFKDGIEMIWSVIAKCPCLVLLTLRHCSGMHNVIIIAPRLETLIIEGAFDYLCLKNAPRLVDVGLRSTKSKMIGIDTVVASICSLATSYELQNLKIGDNLIKLLAAVNFNVLPATFNHLDVLCLTHVMLSDPQEFRFVIGMVQSSPAIRELEISIISGSDVVEQEYGYCSDKYKLGRLHHAKITGITGTSADLKLLKYVLAVSVRLEKLFYKYDSLDAVTEVKVLRQLNQFPRASSKAQLVFLEKYRY